MLARRIFTGKWNHNGIMVPHKSQGSGNTTSGSIVQQGEGKWWASSIKRIGKVLSLKRSYISVSVNE